MFLIRLETVGDTGLSGRAPYSAHIHQVLYKNLDEISRRKDSEGNLYPGRYWLQFGSVPECITVCSGATKFSGEFDVVFDQNYLNNSININNLLEPRIEKRELAITSIPTQTVESVDVSEQIDDEVGFFGDFFINIYGSSVGVILGVVDIHKDNSTISIFSFSCLFQMF